MEKDSDLNDSFSSDDWFNRISGIEKEIAPLETKLTESESAILELEQDRHKHRKIIKYSIYFMWAIQIFAVDFSIVPNLI